jgi:hypothetical protein
MVFRLQNGQHTSRRVSTIFADELIEGVSPFALLVLLHQLTAATVARPGTTANLLGSGWRGVRSSRRRGWGDGFKQGRDFAAWLSLVYSSMGPGRWSGEEDRWRSAQRLQQHAAA